MMRYVGLVRDDDVKMRYVGLVRDNDVKMNLRVVNFLLARLVVL